MAVYKGDKTREIIFPLGGIGSGSIGLAGNGELVDWEIQNNPCKGTLNGYSHFAVRVKTPDGKIDARVLQGDHTKDLMGQYGRRGNVCYGYGFGVDPMLMAGFRHFRDYTFRGEFPIAEISFKDKSFPCLLKLTAFNPFIPHCEDDSSIPAAFFELDVKNTLDEEIEFTAALSVGNLFNGLSESFIKGNVKGVRMFRVGDKENVAWGELVIASDHKNVAVQPYWFRGRWQDGIQTFWREFSDGVKIRPRSYGEPAVFEHAASRDMATIEVNTSLKPRAREKIRFIISWNIPKRRADWEPQREEDGKNATWKNYYAVLYSDAIASAMDGLNRWGDLYRRTDEFRRAVHGMKLDPAVIEAAASNLSVLKSATVLRLEDGSLWGFEGLGECWGSCMGTCTHVWGYEYALPFLFPKLSRTTSELDYKHNLFPDGAMSFRLPLPVGQKTGMYLPCVDGQFVSVMRVYREWKLSGDTEWLKAIYPLVKRSVRYAWDKDTVFGWDRDCDGVLEGRQHHTLDMEMFGPSAWLEGIYIAALEASARMADEMNDKEFAAFCRKLRENGKKWTEEHLFNGEYYMQKVDLGDRELLRRYNGDEYWNEETGEIKYQIGEGCNIDQLLGQWHAHLNG
ncbi:MAG: hypothetical protein K2L51_05170, partial [Clostridiales bacterium]|nr:hypothetical protein [Clostridiales bacterium]